VTGDRYRYQLTNYFSAAIIHDIQNTKAVNISLIDPRQSPLTSAD